MRQLPFRVPDDLADGIETARGGVPRERWLRDVVRAAVEAALSGSGVTAPKPPVPPRARPTTRHQNPAMLARQARLEADRTRKH